MTPLACGSHVFGFFLIGAALVSLLPALLYAALRAGPALGAREPRQGPVPADALLAGADALVLGTLLLPLLPWLAHELLGALPLPWRGGAPTGLYAGVFVLGLCRRVRNPLCPAPGAARRLLRLVGGVALLYAGFAAPVGWLADGPPAAGAAALAGLALGGAGAVLGVATGSRLSAPRADPGAPRSG